MRKGNPIVVSAASGTGKTSLCRRLLQTLSHTARSVSYTTRERRGEEVDGRDYFFISDEEFDQMIAGGEFVEWAQVFTRRYGTGWRAVQRQLEQGLDVLLDIDVQGGLQIRERLPNAVLIFLLPPSMEELRRRLVNRAEDTAEAIELRLAKARSEIKECQGYDYLVVNDDFDQAELDLRAIIRSHHIGRNPPTHLVTTLLEG